MAWITDDNPNAPERDGIRESQLRDIGIDTPVTHGPGGVVTITVSVETLDRIIDKLSGRIHPGYYTDRDVDSSHRDGVAEGRRKALADVEALAKAATA